MSASRASYAKRAWWSLKPWQRDGEGGGSLWRAVASSPAVGDVQFPSEGGLAWGGRGCHASTRGEWVSICSGKEHIATGRRRTFPNPRIEKNR
ncbi:hypothetical protein [Thaumasiovibrio subtropicus]|uniref:hypothetical protein n=1 Tax=Thaumasiovibrio subtropicus TaxID=1891207 RepID=UPI00131C1503|nr:hypothetical protein [Thaumasiovibrio subtropicus]